MWYRKLKLHHWIAIGFAVGLLVGVSRTTFNEEPTLGGPGFISQALFTRAIETAPINSKPYVKNVAIRPSKVVDAIDIVSFDALDTETDSYRPFLFAAPRPFAPGTPPSHYDSVRDYLLSAAATNPAVAPHAAWWEQTSATLTLYALLGMLLIGGVWPVILRLTSSPDSPQSEYDLDRFTHDAPNATTSATTPNDEARLDVLDEELEHATASPPTDSLQESAPIRPLDTTSYMPETLSPADEKKDFSGEFYPVERHAPHAFSLVELIIVIGIIALLFSLLMPSLRHARRAAEQAKCTYNLEQIGRALHEYANANHDWLPAWSDWHTWPPGGPSDNYGPAWTVEMIPYLGNPDSPVYNCPSFPRPQRYRNYFLEAQWAGRSGRNAMKTTDIKLTSRFVLSGDKTNWNLYPSVQIDDADPDDFGPAGALLWPWNGGFYMHRTGNNVLFDDGHVELCSRFDPARMTFNPHRVEDHDQVTPD